MIAKRIGLGFLALTAGVIGFLVFFGIGEGTGSGVAAFAADALLFALVAYGLGRLDPPGSWVYAALACAPVFVLCLLSPDAQYIIGAVAMTVVAMIGAYLATKAPRPSPKPPS